MGLIPDLVRQVWLYRLLMVTLPVERCKKKNNCSVKLSVWSLPRIIFSFSTNMSCKFGHSPWGCEAPPSLISVGLRPTPEDKRLRQEDALTFDLLGYGHHHIYCTTVQGLYAGTQISANTFQTLSCQLPSQISGKSFLPDGSWTNHQNHSWMLHTFSSLLL